MRSDLSAGFQATLLALSFLEDGKPAQPDLEALGRYQRRAGAPGGVWPSSPEISSAMLERHSKKRKGNDPQP
jgi:hypothetical protein